MAQKAHPVDTEWARKGRYKQTQYLSTTDKVAENDAAGQLFNPRESSASLLPLL